MIAAIPQIYVEILTNPVTGETMNVLESNRDCFKFIYQLKQGGAVSAVHYHPQQEQTVSVISGELHCRIGNETRILQAGEKTRIPPGVAHTQWNPNKTDVVAIEELRPAQKSHDMFRVIFALAQTGKTDSRGLPTPLIGAALGSVFREEFRLTSFRQRVLFGFLAPLSRLLGYEQVVHEYIRKLKT